MSVASMTAEEFAASVTGQPGWVVVDFFTDTCPPCKMLAPELERVASESDDVTFVKINAIEDPQLAMAFQVRAVPKLVLLRDGQAVAELNGYQPAAKIQQWIDAHRDA